MNITQATIEDLNRVVPLFNLYRGFYHQTSDLPGATDYIQARLENGDSTIFLAEIDGEDVGFVQLYPTYSSIAMQNSWILNDLYVLEGARKHGVGEALMKRALQLGKETGANAIELSTAIDNTRAQHLYEKLNYTRETDFYTYTLHL
ncbi:N-acetyltransferase family protein [Geomicrobium sp. JSM 1781026]|uniref:GNAT family N-acetyltransferase n=1 Tax=Geomicrobium sp. JSM 1781026 TaxID=3344580 RepID=UPI0035C15E26